MLLKIIHETDLAYSDLISETAMELRMAPRQEQGQHRLSFNLAIGPATAVTSYFDWLGNTVHAFNVVPFHRQIRVVATSVVETSRPPQDPTQFNDQWPVELPPDYSLYDYLQFTGAVVDCPPLRDLVERLNARPGMSLGHLVLRMLGRIDESFTYQQGVTTADSPITEIFQHGRGVCQDFTHLMLAMARALGIPARYVSGFLHPDRQRYRGFAQTHAWCELYFPSTGWVGFDPTNNCIVNAFFVKVATGRHYRDVPPHKGLFRGTVQESISVAVQSEVLAAIPLGLPAERMQSLPVSIYPGGRELSTEPSHQQEVQQQQQRKDELGYHQQQAQQQQ